VTDPPSEFVFKRGCEFFFKHPWRIDFPDGTHVRFSTALLAAETAAGLRLPIWNELSKEFVPIGEVFQIYRNVRRRP